MPIQRAMTEVEHKQYGVHRVFTIQKMLMEENVFAKSFGSFEPLG